MDYFEQLRQQAEANLSQKGRLGEEASSDSEFYEVGVYQTELQIQYEELQRAYGELNQLYEKYWSLYEFAPCGYVTLNSKGMITHTNHQGRALLGNLASPLNNFGFSRFIIPNHQSFFFTALQQVKQTGEKQNIQLQLIPLGDRGLLWVHLDIQANFDNEGTVINYNISLTDVTKDKEADIAREKAKRLQLIAERERLVNTITYAVRQSLELHEVVDKTVTKLLEAFAVDEAVLAFYGKDNKESPLVRVATKEASYCSTKICDYSQAQQIFQAEEVVAINDLATTDHLCFRAEKAQSTLLGRVYYDQQLQGVISLQHHDYSYQWTEEEKHLLKQVADQIAIALQQAQLYKQLNQELTERTQLQNQLHYEAYHDHLTGLPNRYLLTERLDHMVQSRENSQKSELPFAVLFLDLNGFKYVNDKFGHEAGDQLLLNVALRLKNCLREEEMIARFGGDEFVILLEELPTKQSAIEVASRIQATLKVPIVFNNLKLQIGTSIGIVYDEGQYSSSDPILRDADIAMYRSKNMGVDYIIFHETDNVS